MTELDGGEIDLSLYNHHVGRLGKQLVRALRRVEHDVAPLPPDLMQALDLYLIVEKGIIIDDSDAALMAMEGLAAVRT